MKKTSAPKLAREIKIHPARSLEAIIKAKLIAAVIRTTEKKGFTHGELARRTGIPRSAVTGILSGSLQKVTLDRVLRLVDAAELTAEIRVKETA